MSKKLTGGLTATDERRLTDYRKSLIESGMPVRTVNRKIDSYRKFIVKNRSSRHVEQ